MSHSRRNSTSAKHPSYYTLFKPGRFEEVREIIIDKAFPNERKLQDERYAAKRKSVSSLSIK